MVCQLLQTYDAAAFSKQLAKYPLNPGPKVEAEEGKGDEGDVNLVGPPVVGLQDFELRGVMGELVDDSEHACESSGFSSAHTPTAAAAAAAIALIISLCSNLTPPSQACKRGRRCQCALTGPLF